MVYVLKANGEREEFRDEKVLNSIKRAGVPENVQLQVLSEIKGSLFENIPTSVIYNKILDSLGKSPQPYAKAKYSLKQAIMMLGPTGYPFEDFVAKILEADGYKTQTRQILMGHCVNHEIDVLAEKDGRKIIIEAKFHNSLGVRTDLHVALYTKARFDDLKLKHNLNEAWIITNTKVTTEAITYAKCRDMKVIGWSYPDGGSLRDLIEKSKLHPITLLTTLSPAQKLMLLENHVVTCKYLKEHQTYLQLLHLSKEQQDQLFAELAFICGEQP